MLCRPKLLLTMLRFLIKKTLRKKEIETAAKAVLLGKALFSNLVNLVLPVKYINIGGGPVFSFPFWLNLDSASSFLNRNPNVFDKNFSFPVPNSKINIVYSSHCIEHLEETVVKRLLFESYRVLKSGGKLIVKIPDYDLILENYRENRISFFQDPSLGLPDFYEERWKCEGIENSIENITSFLFFSYSHGLEKSMFEDDGRTDIFFAYRKEAFKNRNFFIGPLPINSEQLRKILELSSPRQITKTLLQKSKGILKEKKIFFNHISAWNTSEFQSILDELDFELISTDKEKVTKDYDFIPGICEMYNWSKFLTYQKK